MPPSGRSKHTPTTLYRNLLIETGEPNFKDVTREANLMRAGNTNDHKIGGIGSTSGGVAWADYDNDAILTCFGSVLSMMLTMPCSGITEMAHLQM